MGSRIILFVIVLSGYIAAPGSAKAQFIDSVHSVSFGPNYNTGYGPDNIYFPACIYGPPDSNARPFGASFGPWNLLSLGTGGEIILRFFSPVINGPGVDFTVFENAFYVTDTNYSFAETGIVSVSRDGINFIEFPYHFDTSSVNPLRFRYYGLAGVTPTNSLASPFDPGSPGQGHSGGDSFDLSASGLDTVYYIKIKDAGKNVPDGGDSFDLDAIAVINRVSSITNNFSGNSIEGYKLEQNYPNPFNPVTAIRFSIPAGADITLKIYDNSGKEVSEIVKGKFPGGSHEVRFDGSGLPSGVYFYQLKENNVSLMRKMILIK